jgi:hypothetical protein
MAKISAYQPAAALARQPKAANISARQSMAIAAAASIKISRQVMWRKSLASNGGNGEISA